MFCVKCGNELKDDMKFCNKCGTKVVETTENKNSSQNNTKSSNKKSNLHIIIGIGVVVIGIIIFNAIIQSANKSSQEHGEYKAKQQLQSGILINQ